MKRIYKYLTAFLLIFVLIATNMTQAMSNADTMRVFKKMHQDSAFMSQLYSRVPLYASLGVTEDSLDDTMQKMIYSIFTFAEMEKEKGTLTRDNLKERLKVITAERAANMGAAYLALCTDAFSKETLVSFLNGDIPAEFAPLYSTITDEAYRILGFGEKQSITHVFDDLTEYAWAEEAIAYLFDKDIINGVSDFSFAPSDRVTREQFAKMICIAFQIESSDKVSVFADVKETDWFYPYVTAMASQHLIEGIGDGVFGSGQNITRQDMAVMMFRMGKLLDKIDGNTLSETDFEDDRYIASYAKDAVIALKEIGIINGDEKHCFNPTMSATRAEAAQMLYRCYRYLYD